MATSLYFHAAASSVANLPTDEQSSLAPDANKADAVTVNRSMDTSVGVSPTSLVITTTADTNAHNYYFSRFCTLPLKDVTSITAQTWTYKFAAKESNTAANFPCTGTNKAVRVTAYVWRPGTGKVGNILDGTSNNTVDESTAGTETYHVVTFSGSLVSGVQDGDVICFEVWFVVTQGTGAAYTDTFYYDGTTESAENATVTTPASLISTPQDLTFGYRAKQTFTHIYNTKHIVGSSTILTDGVDGSYINCGNQAGLWSKDLTKFSLFIRIYPMVDSVGGNDKLIINHGWWTGNLSFLLYNYGTGDDFSFGVKDASGVNQAAHSASNSWVPSQWFDVACTYDNSLGSANVKIYLNKTVGANTANCTVTANISDVLGISQGGAGHYANVKVKDFRFWDSIALTQQQVNDVSDNLSSAPAPQYWLKMDEATGNPVDAVGGSLSGTLTGGSTWSGGAPSMFIGTKFTHIYNIKNLIAQTFTHIYNILTTVLHATQSFTHIYNSRALATASLTHKFNIKNLILQSFTHRFDIKNLIAQTFTHISNIKNLATQTFTHRFNIKSLILQSYTHLYKLRQLALQSFTHRFNSLQLVKTPSESIYFPYDTLPSTYSLTSDGQTSPNGKWRMPYHGSNPQDGGDLGQAGVRVPGSPTNGFDRVVYEYPYSQTNTGSSSSATVIVTDGQYYQAFDITIWVRTIDQRKSTPHAWECPWIFFRYNEAEGLYFHHYYVALKVDGTIEFGKKDNSTQEEHQYFFSTGQTYSYTINEWNKVRIRGIRNHFTIWVDDVQKIDMSDDGTHSDWQDPGNPFPAASKFMYYGMFGLYNEDCEVEFSVLNIAAYEPMFTHIYNTSQLALQSFTHKFNIRSLILQSFTHIYNIKNLIAQTFTHISNINNLVSQLFTHKFNLKNLVVQAFTHIYNVLGLAQAVQSFIHTYNIKNLSTQSFTHEFNIKNLASQTFTHISNIAQLATQSFIHRSNIRGLVNQLFTHEFNINNLTVQSFTHISNIKNIISQTFTHRFNIYNLAIQSFTHRFNIINTITQSFIHRSSILQLVTQSFIHTYNILGLGQVLKSFTHIYNVKQLTAQTYTHTSNIKNLISQTLTHIYNIKGLASQLFTHEYNLRQLVSNTFINVYNILGLELVTQAFTHLFDIKELTIQSYTHRSNIRNIVVQALTHSFNIFNTAAQSFTHSYDIKQLATQLFSQLYNITGRIFQTFIHRYEIKALIDTTNSDPALIVTKWLKDSWTNDPYSTVEFYLIPPKDKITFGQRFEMSAGSHSDMHIHVRNITENPRFMNTDWTLQENSDIVSIYVEVRYIPEMPKFSSDSPAPPSRMMWQIRAYIDELIRSDAEQLENMGIDAVSLLQEVPDSNTPVEVHGQSAVEQLYTIMFTVKLYYGFRIDRVS